MLKTDFTGFFYPPFWQFLEWSECPPPPPPLTPRFRLWYISWGQQAGSLTFHKFAALCTLVWSRSQHCRKYRQEKENQALYCLKNKYLNFALLVATECNDKLNWWTLGGSIGFFRVSTSHVWAWRRHKQRFRKIATTVVLDKDETLLWSGLKWLRSCHSNEMRPSPILLAAVFLGTGNWSSKIVHGSIFPPHPWHLWLVNHSQQALRVLWVRHQSIQRTVKLSKGQSSPTNLMSIVYFPGHLMATTL